MIGRHSRSTTANRTSHLYTMGVEMVTASRADAKPTGWTGRRLHVALFIACALGAAGLLGAAMVLHVWPWAEEPLPVFWAVPTFTLTDQQGRPFRSADLNGRAALFSFVYTNC